MKKAPNILLIMADQLRHDCVAYSGGPHPVLTPNIDFLARSAHRFSQAYVPNPYCVPSRACLFSGRYPHENGIQVNDDGKVVQGELLVDLLEDAGYQVALSGKRHVRTPRLPQLVDAVEERGEDLAPLCWPQAWEKLWTSPPPASRLRRVTRAGLSFLEQRDAQRPFFLWASYVEPHARGNGYEQAATGAFDCPEGRHWDAPFRRDQAPLPPRKAGEFSDKPERLRREIASWHAVENDAELADASCRYYGSVACLDSHIGRLLRFLKEKDLWDDTLILFMSDHGEFLGEHGLYRKRNCLYDCLTRIPLVVKMPGQKTGESHDFFVEEIDLAPSLLEACALPRGRDMKGRNLLKMIEGEEERREKVFLEMGEGDLHIRGLRNRRHLLVDWGRGEGEFYDLEKDPFQLNNLFDEKTFEKERALLLEQLRTLP
jgi:arylsulfatase A-like enzyme